MKRTAALITAAVMVIGLAPIANADTGDRTTVAALLNSLPERAESAAGYDRDLFRHWISTDGCTTREWLLIRQAIGGQRSGCVVVGATWYSRYDAQRTNNPSSFDIDHLVPLAEAWGSGASTWTSARREAFANDLGYRPSLIAVTASSNRSKGDRDPAEWMPPAEGYWCKYVRQWVAVKYRWGLAVDPAEKAAIVDDLEGCRLAIIAPAKA
jgi:hypothetical protein